MKTHDTDESTAVGLVWGLLDAGQFDEAARLAHAARLVWPVSDDLLVLSAFALALAGPGAGRVDRGPDDDADTDAAQVTHAADPRWNALLATLHQRERLRQEHLATLPFPSTVTDAEPWMP